MVKRSGGRVWGLKDRETHRERDRQLAVGVSEIAERDGNEFYTRRSLRVGREMGGEVWCLALDTGGN